MALSRPASNDALAARLTAVRDATPRLCEPLEAEDYAVQPLPEVSPPKWHLGHTSWFFERFLLRPYLSGYRVFDEGYGLLFNSYYKSAGPHWLQRERGVLSRPATREVLAYRRHVDDAMSALLGTARANPEVSALTEAGIQHEQQHQELLLMDIKYILGINPSMPPYAERPPAPTGRGADGWVSIEPGIHAIGAEGPGFSYDNERPRHRVWLESCEIAGALVSNAEFLDFMQDGGYSEPRLWQSKGWDWVQAQGVRAPLYWFEHDGTWQEYTLAGAAPLDGGAPVMHVSWFEAEAYARWRGCRLPTEEEYEVFLRRSSAADAPSLWCWTRSHYSPYPGFRPFDGPLAEYNGKFMCNQFVLRGGCFATPPGHHRDTYRNFFEPQQRWMFSGIRLARG